MQLIGQGSDTLAPLLSQGGGQCSNLMTNPEAKLSTPLLVVDDRSDVLQALVRYFELDFENVLAAQSPIEAEALLSRHKPHFLLCDYWLGENYPPSTDLLPGWRRDNPCLKRVVLMTGTKSSSIPPCSAVDDVFAKPLRLSKMVEYFRRFAVSTTLDQPRLSTSA